MRSLMQEKQFKRFQTKGQLTGAVTRLSMLLDEHETFDEEELLTFLELLSICERLLKNWEN